MRRALWQFLILVVLAAMAGCSDNSVAAGENGILVKPGEWTGSSDTRANMLEFTVGVNGANIFVASYAYPCGEKFAYVFPPQPIKVELKDSAFEMKVDGNDFNPGFRLTGKFSDKTHVEGTWEVSRFYNSFLETSCAAANGTWKGSPK